MTLYNTERIRKFAPIKWCTALFGARLSSGIFHFSTLFCKCRWTKRENENGSFFSDIYLFFCCCCCAEWKYNLCNGRRWYAEKRHTFTWRTMPWNVNISKCCKWLWLIWACIWATNFAGTCNQLQNGQQQPNNRTHCAQFLMSYFVASETLFVSSCKCHWSISSATERCLERMVLLLKIPIHSLNINTENNSTFDFSCQKDCILDVHNFLHFIFICLCIFKTLNVIYWLWCVRFSGQAVHL